MKTVAAAMAAAQTGFAVCCAHRAPASRTPTRCKASATPPQPARRRLLHLGALSAAAALLPALPAIADPDEDIRTQLKVSGGSASTSATKAKSVIKTVTRGVVLEGADFSGQSYEGISFQQSILRQADFSGASLRDASFFDADLTGANFRGADLRGVNFELANLRDADMTDANLSGAYISSTTKFAGITIEGSDWSDTLLRKDQQKFLCGLAKGANPATGVDTRESLFCLD